MNDTVTAFQPRLALGDTPATGHAQLTNMRLGLQTYVTCADAAPGLPRLGVFHGPSGFGKSVAAAFVAQRADALYIEAKSIWTQRSLLEAIADELGISKLERSAPRILDQIIAQLNNEPRGILIDEMDHLVRKQHVEIIRDIHDATRVPIVMIGEEALPQKLKDWERFHNRILITMPAQPSTFEDAQKLRQHYCSQVEIADDLVARIAEATRGVTRRIVVNLQEVHRLGLQAGRSEVDLEWWGDRPFSTGDVLARRRAA